MESIDIVDVAHSAEDKLKTSKKIDTSVVFLTYDCDDTQLTSESIFDVYYRHGFDGILVVDEFTKKKKKYHHVLLIKQSGVTIRHLYMFDIYGEHAIIRYAKKTGVGKIIDYCMKGRKSMRDVPEGLSKVKCFGINVQTQSQNNNYRTDESEKVDKIITPCSEGVSRRLKKQSNTSNPYTPLSVTLTYEKSRDEFYYPKVVKNWFKTNVDERIQKNTISKTPTLIITGLTGPWGSALTDMIRAWGPHMYYYGNNLPMQDFEPSTHIPSEVKYIVIDGASGLFQNNVNYDAFGKQLLNSKGVFGARIRPLTNVACYNHLPVVWIQNCNDTTYKFWEDKDPSDWKLGSTYVECVPVKQDKYDEINERYLKQTDYFDKGAKVIVESWKKKKALERKAKELEVQYASSGRELSDLYSFSRKDREAKIEKLSSVAGLDRNEFTKRLYGDIGQEEVGVYVQWEVVQDDEEESVNKYYRSLTRVEKQKEYIKEIK